MSDVKSRRFLLRLVLLIVIPVIALAIAGYFYLVSGRFISTENAYLKSDIVQISTVLDGQVVQVAVKDHSNVSKGDLLFRLDPKPFEIQVAQAEAELASARTAIETLRAVHAEAKAEIGEVDAQIGYLQRQLERQQMLRNRGVTSREYLDRAVSDLEIAKERKTAAERKLYRTLTALVGDPDIDTTKHPLYQEKLSMLEQAKFNLERSTIFAPQDGTITNMKLQPGEYVEEGRPVFSLISTGSPWVEANLKETDLTHVRVGQTAKVVVDAYPGRTFEAQVDSISPATGAEFAVLPPQNATGNWVKVVQRLPVKLVITETDGEETPLRAGMTVSISIDTEYRRPALVALQEAFDGSAHAAD
jgi:membrane fusion protein, multidrug efflux system